MKIQNVRGGFDFLPKEQRVRNYIRNVLIKVFEEYGFKSIETPILCYYDMLSDKYDENNDILKEIYRLKDQGNRDLGLRYDLTVPFAKFIALNKNKISFPFRRYEINKVFRDGPVRVGRDREFTQCDADVVGINGQYVEAELLSLYVRAFSKLNIDIVIKYNNRNLMSGLIMESGVPENLVSNVTTILDKKDKMTNKEIDALLFEIGLNDYQIDNINNYFYMSLGELTEKFKDSNNDKIKVGLCEVNQLVSYLSDIGINNYCEFTISLARGQNYYTGNVFEVYEKTGLIKGSIGGGGRYDKIVGDFIGDGNVYPTVGISFGLSSIYELLKDSKIFADKSEIDFFIIPLDTESESLQLANNIRNMGYNVEIDMTKNKVRKSMEYANREKIPFVIVLGKKEIDEQKFDIKNMLTSEKISIYFTSLGKIKDLIN